MPVDIGEKNVSDDSEISNTDLFLGVAAAESDTLQPDFQTGLDIIINHDNDTNPGGDPVPVNLPLRAETLTDDESISLSQSPTTSDYADYSLEIFENIISPRTGEQTRINSGYFETTTETTEPPDQTIWDSLNSFNEINGDFHTEEEFREFSDHQLSGSTDLETTTFSPDSLPSNVNYTTWKQLELQQLTNGELRPVTVPSSQTLERVPNKKPDVTEANVSEDDSDTRKRDRTFSGLQYFNLGPAMSLSREQPRREEKKSVRSFLDGAGAGDVIDNEISDTKVDKVKIRPSEDMGKEVSVTINITEYSGLEGESPNSQQEHYTGRQDYGPPAPAPASAASLPASCYTTTTCTASCGPGFQLVIPNTGTAECRSGVLEVLPCDQGPCPQHCAWSTWTSWSDCQAAPGQLDCTQARTREVARQEVGAGRPCQGEDREARYCVSLTCQGKHHHG